MVPKNKEDNDDNDDDVGKLMNNTNTNSSATTTSTTMTNNNKDNHGCKNNNNVNVNVNVNDNDNENVNVSGENNGTGSNIDNGNDIDNEEILDCKEEVECLGIKKSDVEYSHVIIDLVDSDSGSEEDSDSNDSDNNDSNSNSNKNDESNNNTNNDDNVVASSSLTQEQQRQQQQVINTRHTTHDKNTEALKSTKKKNPKTIKYATTTINTSSNNNSYTTTTDNNEKKNTNIDDDYHRNCSVSSSSSSSKKERKIINDTSNRDRNKSSGSTDYCQEHRKEEKNRISPPTPLLTTSSSKLSLLSKNHLHINNNQRKAVSQASNQLITTTSKQEKKNVSSSVSMLQVPLSSSSSSSKVVSRSTPLLSSSSLSLSLSLSSSSPTSSSRSSRIAATTTVATRLTESKSATAIETKNENRSKINVNEKTLKKNKSNSSSNNNSNSNNNNNSNNTNNAEVIEIDTDTDDDADNDNEEDDEVQLFKSEKNKDIYHGPSQIRRKIFEDRKRKRTMMTTNTTTRHDDDGGSDFAVAGNPIPTTSMTSNSTQYSTTCNDGAVNNNNNRGIHATNDRDDNEIEIVDPSSSLLRVRSSSTTTSSSSKISSSQFKTSKKAAPSQLPLPPKSESESESLLLFVSAQEIAVSAPEIAVAVAEGSNDNINSNNKTNCMVCRANSNPIQKSASTTVLESTKQQQQHKDTSYSVTGKEQTMLDSRSGSRSGGGDFNNNINHSNDVDNHSEPNSTRDGMINSGTNTNENGPSTSPSSLLLASPLTARDDITTTMTTTTAKVTNNTAATIAIASPSFSSRDRNRGRTSSSSFCGHLNNEPSSLMSTLSSSLKSSSMTTVPSYQRRNRQNLHHRQRDLSQQQQQQFYSSSDPIKNMLPLPRIISARDDRPRKEGEGKIAISQRNLRIKKTIQQPPNSGTSNIDDNVTLTTSSTVAAAAVTTQDKSKEERIDRNFFYDLQNKPVKKQQQQQQQRIHQQRVRHHRNNVIASLSNNKGTPLETKSSENIASLLPKSSSVTMVEKSSVIGSTKSFSNKNSGLSFDSGIVIDILDDDDDDDDDSVNGIGGTNTVEFSLSRRRSRQQNKEEQLPSDRRKRQKVNSSSSKISSSPLPADNIIEILDDDDDDNDNDADDNSLEGTQSKVKNVGFKQKKMAGMKGFSYLNWMDSSSSDNETGSCASFTSMNRNDSIPTPSIKSSSPNIKNNKMKKQIRNIRINKLIAQVPAQPKEPPPLPNLNECKDKVRIMYQKVHEEKEKTKRSLLVNALNKQRIATNHNMLSNKYSSRLPKSTAKITYMDKNNVLGGEAHTTLINSTLTAVLTTSDDNDDEESSTSDTSDNKESDVRCTEVKIIDKAKDLQLKPFQYKDLQDLFSCILEKLSIAERYHPSTHNFISTQLFPPCTPDGMRNDIKLDVPPQYKNMPLSNTNSKTENLKKNKTKDEKSTTPAAATMGTSSKPSANDRKLFNDFNKTSKSEKDYEILKNEVYFYGWKSKFEKKVQVHKYKRLLDSKYDDTDTHRLHLTKDSYDLELFEEQVNFLSIIFEYTLRTVKGTNLVQTYPDDPIQLWKKLISHHNYGYDSHMESFRDFCPLCKVFDCSFHDNSDPDAATQAAVAVQYDKLFLKRQQRQQQQQSNEIDYDDPYSSIQLAPGGGVILMRKFINHAASDLVKLVVVEPHKNDSISSNNKNIISFVHGGSLCPFCQFSCKDKRKLFKHVSRYHQDSYFCNKEGNIMTMTPRNEGITKNIEDFVPKQTYFHSRNLIPYGVKEDYERDSDDESDYSWYHEYRNKLLDDIANISWKEKQLQSMWNNYIGYSPAVISDEDVPKISFKFIEEHKLQLKELEWELYKLLLVLWERRFLRVVHVIKLLYLYHREKGSNMFEVKESITFTHNQKENKTKMFEDEASITLTYNQKVVVSRLHLIFKSFYHEKDVLLALSCSIKRKNLKKSDLLPTPILPEPNWKNVKKKRSMPHKQHGDRARSFFYPCRHSGVCNKNNCSCIKAEYVCTKACIWGNCGSNFFQGCTCQKDCRNSVRCPCRDANRECDPDVCRCCRATARHSDGGCANMDVTMGRRIRSLLVGKSTIPGAGLGLFTKNALKKGQYIDEYIGELIRYSDPEDNIAYNFTYTEDYTMNAAKQGNKTRYLNHSKTPNLECKQLFVNGETRLTFYAQKDIQAQSELFYCYSKSYNDTWRSRGLADLCVDSDDYVR